MELESGMKDTRKRYRCKCPICGREFWACKSIAQEDWGMLDAGHGSCPGCETFHNLTFDEKTEEMIVTPWDKFLEEKNKTEDIK